LKINNQDTTSSRISRFKILNRGTYGGRLTTGLSKGKEKKLPDFIFCKIHFLYVPFTGF
jgi:hypothetical protein